MNSKLYTTRCTHIEFGGALNVAEIVKFIDEGGNVLLAASSDVGRRLDFVLIGIVMCR
jgi:hypothetical protein